MIEPTDYERGVSDGTNIIGHKLSGFVGLLLAIEGHTAWRQKFYGTSYVLFDLYSGVVALPLTELMIDSLELLREVPVKEKLNTLPAETTQAIRLNAWCEKIGSRYVALERLVEEYRRKIDEQKEVSPEAEGLYAALQEVSESTPEPVDVDALLRL